MITINRVILIGNMVAEPEVREFQSGNKNCSFRLGVQRNFKNSNGVYDSDFISCVAWRQNAEFLSKYIHKGNRVAVEGAIQSRSYDDSNGNKRYVVEVIVDRVENLTPRQTTNGYADAPADAPADNGGFTEINTDELPF